MREDIATAVEVIRAGGIVGMPTDTVYGIGVDPGNDDAVAQLFEVKGRPAARPVGLLVASLEQARTMGLIEGEALELARRHWPGALTLVVRPLVILADWVGDRQADTVGIRMPDHSVAIELLEATGPISVTSANRSGFPEATDEAGARAIFGDRVHYVAGSSPGGEPSTVVDVTGTRPVVLRQGPVTLPG